MEQKILTFRERLFSSSGNKSGSTLVCLMRKVYLTRNVRIYVPVIDMDFISLILTNYDVRY